MITTSEGHSLATCQKCCIPGFLFYSAVLSPSPVSWFSLHCFSIFALTLYYIFYFILSHGNMGVIIQYLFYIIIIITIVCVSVCV